MSALQPLATCDLSGVADSSCLDEYCTNATRPTGQEEHKSCIEFQIHTALRVSLVGWQSVGIHGCKYTDCAYERPKLLSFFGYFMRCCIQLKHRHPFSVIVMQAKLHEQKDVLFNEPSCFMHRETDRASPTIYL